MRMQPLTTEVRSYVPSNANPAPEKKPETPFSYLRKLIVAPLVSIAERAIRNSLDKELDVTLRNDLAKALLRSKRGETGGLTLDQIVGLKSVPLDALYNGLSLMKPKEYADKLAEASEEAFPDSPEHFAIQALSNQLHMEAAKRGKTPAHEDLYVIRNLCAPQIDTLLYDQYVIGQTAQILLNIDAPIADRIKANIILKHTKSRQAALLSQMKAVTEVVVTPPNKFERIMRRVDPYMGGIRLKIDLPTSDQIYKLRDQFVRQPSSSFDQIYKTLIQSPKPATNVNETHSTAALPVPA